VDVRLAIASKRDERRYADRPIPAEVERRILDAGRLAGSARNRQPWELVVVSDPSGLAETVYEPSNLRTAALVVALVGGGGLDFGRCAQNMLLAAWGEGVISCPNGIKDPAAAEAILGGEPAIVLSFGYPATPRNPAARSPEEWSQRANRKPLDELVRRI
jgi:nitroreductase